MHVSTGGEIQRLGLAKLLLIILFFYGSVGGLPFLSIAVNSSALGQDESGQSRIIAAEQAFSGRLFQAGRPRGGEGEGNFVQAPAGVFQSLAILALAAGETTRSELLGALSVKEDELNLERPLSVDWSGAVAAEESVDYRADFPLVENNGYGLRVARPPAENGFGQQAGLHQGDLIFRVDGLVMRKVEDFQQACRASSGKVLLEGYELELGEAFTQRELKLRKVTTEKREGAGAFQNLNFGVFTDQVNPSSKFLVAANRGFGFEATQLTPLDQRSLSSAEFKAWLSGISNRRFESVRSDLVDVTNARFLIANLARFESSWGMFAKPGGDREFLGFEGASTLRFFELEGEQFRHLQFEQLEFFAIPLKSAGYEFRIFVPTERTKEAFAGVRDLLSDPEVHETLESQVSEPESLRVSIPVFSATSSVNRSSLQSLFSLKEAFSLRANFSELSKDLMLGDMAQWSQIVVDHRGVFAEAQTGAVGVPKAAPQNFKSITIDHPFFFQIRRRDGLVLFQGQIVDPATSAN